MMKMSHQRSALAALTLATLAPLPASALIKSADAAGRYAVIREDKDTGCMLTLDRDRLVLSARKGHKAHFDRGADGVWRRDATEGKSLGLKPL